MSPADITAFRAKLGTWLTKLKAVLDAQHALDLANGQAQQEAANQLPDLRRRIQNLKTTTGYDPGIGADLGLVASGSSAFDPATYQPELTDLATFPGYVRVKGKKLGAESINIYMRRAGEAAFKLIAVRRSRFPYDDDTPLAVPSTPEIREYQLRGVLNDNEIGQSSPILTITYGG